MDLGLVVILLTIGCNVLRLNLQIEPSGCGGNTDECGKEEDG
jgi:hypothetical protein